MRYSSSSSKLSSQRGICTSFLTPRKVYKYGYCYARCKKKKTARDGDPRNHEEQQPGLGRYLLTCPNVKNLFQQENKMRRNESKKKQKQENMKRNAGKKNNEKIKKWKTKSKKNKTPSSFSPKSIFQKSLLFKNKEGKNEPSKGGVLPSETT